MQDSSTYECSSSRIFERVQRIRQMLVDLDQSIQDKYSSYFIDSPLQDKSEMKNPPEKMTTIEYEESFTKHVHNLLDVYHLCALSVCKQMDCIGMQVISLFLKQLIVSQRRNFLFSLKTICAHNKIKPIIDETQFRIPTSEVEKDLLEFTNVLKYGDGRRAGADITNKKPKFQRGVIDKDIIELLQNDFKEDQELFPQTLRQYVGQIYDTEKREYSDVNVMMENMLKNKERFLSMEPSNCLDIMSTTLKRIEGTVDNISKFEQQTTSDNSQNDNQIQPFEGEIQKLGDLTKEVKININEQTQQKMQEIVSTLVNNIRNNQTVAGNKNQCTSTSSQTDLKTQVFKKIKSKKEQSSSSSPSSALLRPQTTKEKERQEQQMQISFLERELQQAQSKIFLLNEELEKTQKQLQIVETKKENRVGYKEQEILARDLKLKLDRQARQRDKQVQTQSNYAERNYSHNELTPNLAQLREIPQKDIEYSSRIHEVQSKITRNEIINSNRADSANEGESQVKYPFFGIYGGSSLSKNVKVTQSSDSSYGSTEFIKNIFQNCGVYQQASIANFLLNQESDSQIESLILPEYRQYLNPFKEIFNILSSHELSEQLSIINKIRYLLSEKQPSFTHSDVSQKEGAFNLTQQQQLMPNYSIQNPSSSSEQTSKKTKTLKIIHKKRSSHSLSSLHRPQSNQRNSSNSPSPPQKTTKLLATSSNSKNLTTYKYEEDISILKSNLKSTNIFSDKEFSENNQKSKLNCTAEESFLKQTLKEIDNKQTHKEVKSIPRNRSLSGVSGIGYLSDAKIVLSKTKADGFKQAARHNNLMFLQSKLEKNTQPQQLQQQQQIQTAALNTTIRGSFNSSNQSFLSHKLSSLISTAKATTTQIAEDQIRNLFQDLCTNQNLSKEILQILSGQNQELLDVIIDLSRHPFSTETYEKQLRLQQYALFKKYFKRLHASLQQNLINVSQKNNNQSKQEESLKYSLSSRKV